MFSWPHCCSAKTRSTCMPANRSSGNGWWHTDTTSSIGLGANCSNHDFVIASDSVSWSATCETQTHTTNCSFVMEHTRMCSKTGLQNWCLHLTRCLYYHYIQQSQLPVYNTLNPYYHALRYFNDAGKRARVWACASSGWAFHFSSSVLLPPSQKLSTDPDVRQDLKFCIPRQWRSTDIP